MTSALQRLQDWFVRACDGEWEHGCGVRIDTLDNPGWSIDIVLGDRACGRTAFTPMRLDRSPQDWLDCRVEEDTFLGRGGPSNLEEIIDIFLRWTGGGSDPGETEDVITKS